MSAAVAGAVRNGCESVAVPCMVFCISCSCLRRTYPRICTRVMKRAVSTSGMRMNIMEKAAIARAPAGLGSQTSAKLAFRMNAPVTRISEICTQWIEWQQQPVLTLFGQSLAQDSWYSRTCPEIIASSGAG